MSPVPYRHGMNGLRLAGCGMLIVLADLKFDGFDVLVDAVGWVLVLIGLSRLTRLDAEFSPAKTLTGPAIIISFSEISMPEGASPQTVAIFVLVTTAAVVVVTCTALMRAAKRAGDEATVTMASQVRSANALTTLVAVVIAILSGGEPSDVTGGAGLLVVLLVIAGFAASLWFIVLLVSRADRPYLQNPSLTEAEVG